MSIFTNVAKKIDLVFVVFAIVLLSITIIVGFALFKTKDSTDSQNGGRSGLVLHIDSLTGCEYLSRSSSLVPRIAADGITHSGCKDKK